MAREVSAMAFPFTLLHQCGGADVFFKACRASRSGAVAKTGGALVDLVSMPSPVSLDQVLYPDFSEFWLARANVDRIILGFCAELEDADFQHCLKYNNSKGLPFEKPFGLLLLHFFNHQTHHRGQVSTLLAQLDVDVGVTDLLVNIPG